MLNSCSFVEARHSEIGISESKKERMIDKKRVLTKVKAVQFGFRRIV